MSVSKVMLLFCAASGFLLAALPHLVWLACWVASRLNGHVLRYAPFGWTAVGLVLAFWGLMAYGYFIGRWKLEVVPVTYSNATIPKAFDGYRIVHISDLHLSTFDDSPEQLDRFVETINRQQPDLVCFTGDLVTIGRQEAEPYTKVLKSIKAKDGIVSVLGNHDFLLYSRGFADEQAREAAVEALASYEADSLGWHLLRDSSLRIGRDGQYITVIGVDNKNCTDQGFRTIDRGDLQKAMEGTDGFRILLTHDPSHWDAEVTTTDIPLTLSGHTHAAQFRIFGWALSRLLFRQSDGRYDKSGQTLYINRGLGCTAPFRIGADPEITVVTLNYER